MKNRSCKRFRKLVLEFGSDESPLPKHFRINISRLGGEESPFTMDLRAQEIWDAIDTGEKLAIFSASISYAHEMALLHLVDRSTLHRVLPALRYSVRKLSDVAEDQLLRQAVPSDRLLHTDSPERGEKQKGGEAEPNVLDSLVQGIREDEELVCAAIQRCPRRGTLFCFFLSHEFRTWFGRPKFKLVASVASVLSGRDQSEWDVKQACRRARGYLDRVLPLLRRRYPSAVPSADPLTLEDERELFRKLADLGAFAISFS